MKSDVLHPRGTSEWGERLVAAWHVVSPRARNASVVRFVGEKAFARGNVSEEILEYVRTGTGGSQCPTTIGAERAQVSIRCVYSMKILEEPPIRR